MLVEKNIIKNWSVLNKYRVLLKQDHIHIFIDPYLSFVCYFFAR